MCFAVFQYFDNRAEAHNFLKILGARQLDIQNAYLCGCVKVLPVARHYTSKLRRGNTRAYYMNNGERSVRICKTAFLRIHGYHMVDFHGSWQVRLSKGDFPS